LLHDPFRNDGLVLKNALHRVVGPLVGVYTDFTTVVMANASAA
jgi:hypothetical protein